MARWSWRATPTQSSASRSLRVISTSSRDGAGSPGGMIMDDDQRRGVQEEGPLHDLAGVHGGVVDRTSLLHFISYQVVFPVEKEDPEALDLLVRHGHLAIVEQRLPVA